MTVALDPKSPDSRVVAAQAGANHHIAKPITPARLLEGIDLALSQPAPPTATLLGVGA